MHAKQGSKDQVLFELDVFTELQIANASLRGNLQLIAGMSVSVAVTGRKTTFSQYLIAPFFTMFDDAIQGQGLLPESSFPVRVGLCLL